jgi:hypothetical protein
MKTIDLPLAEPVPLILEFVILDPRKTENVIQVHVWMEFFYIFQIVLD